MQLRPLAHTDLHVSPICLGTMTYGDQNTEAEAHQQLDYAIAQGINFIDTAEMYPVPPKAETYTRTETMVGNWLKHQPRDKIILSGKVAGPRRGLGWIRGGPPSLDRANIRAAIEGSLQRMQTDYIDLYQLHWPERNVPMFGQYQFDPAQEFENGQQKEWVSIRNQLETLAELVKEGKIRYIGLSNEQPWGLMEFLRIAKEYDLPRVATVQNCYNLINRGMEFGMTEVLYRENVGLLAYSPLAFGHLTGKYIDDPQAVGRVTMFLGYAQRYKKPNVGPASAAYAALARRHGLTPTQLALAFVYQRWFVSSTIIGATSMTQLQENIAAWQTRLSQEILQEIEALHLTYMNPAP
ncbi:aryl-alcohol dehydrogenase-like predicted oxidoreductase [Methylovorus glucosotrophus]|uniref:aldo/keto reductase n=1 Tax=Methylovorus glucosotrophus TaxID=266009 RepID=UPI0013317419|nr:aldo/keto reductase [Methylovorus glucosotrophus]KAF0843195.1 aryl-alcohol dehydrogenase-like predicted oxidoreductase [Methylovorus glucosotrophus]